MASFFLFFFNSTLDVLWISNTCYLEMQTICVPAEKDKNPEVHFLLSKLNPN